MSAVLVVAAAALFTITCGFQARPTDTKEGVFWRTLGSWSGHGNTQTGSFTTESGSLRVHWETRNETPRGGGAFRVTTQSAISGRPLKVAVEQQGIGRGISYVDGDPHVFYMVVESANLDWSFTVEEAFAGTVTESGRSGKR